MPSKVVILAHCIGFFSLVALGPHTVAQDEPPVGETQNPVSEPRLVPATDNYPPSSGIEPLSEADVKMVRGQFDEKSKRFRDVFKELNRIRHFYPFADSRQQVMEMQQQFAELKIEGEKAIVEMQWLALPLFRTEPNRNSMFYRFLFDMLVESVENGRYYSGYRTAVLLRETVGYEPPLEQIVALAAFMNNQYDEFQAYVDEVGPEGMLEQHLELVNLVDSERAKWEKEKVIRLAEMEKDDLPRVKLVTSTGEIIIELYENEAPNTVANFISLVEDGFYDGLTFHRVIAGFVAQGGCPEGTGRGYPGYRIECECHQDNRRNHFIGTLSMAHGGRDTAGSQFFICYSPQPELDGLHTAFGRVIKGLEFAEHFERIDPDKLEGDENPSKIIKAEVIRKRDHEYKPKTLEINQ